MIDLNFVNQHKEVIERFRERDISSFDTQDEDVVVVKVLFNSLLDALQNLRKRKSPVAISKALHLLAPKFFPLWDDEYRKGVWLLLVCWF